MEIDPRFPTRLNSASDAPEPFRGALEETLSDQQPRLLLHAPAFETAKGLAPATVLAVTETGWAVFFAAEDGVAITRADFSETTFLRLAPVLLSVHLSISFVAQGTAQSVTLTFETVGDDLYLEATDLILTGIDPGLAAGEQQDLPAAPWPMEGWPLKLRNEVHRFRPKRQRLLALQYWPAVTEASGRQLAPAGVLLITLREIVVISDEQKPSEQLSPSGEVEESFAGIVTFIPRVRLAQYEVSRRENIGVLAFRMHAGGGEITAEIAFPAEEEAAFAEVMGQTVDAGNGKN